MDRMALNQLQKNVWTSWFGEGLYHLSMVIWGMFIPTTYGSNGSSGSQSVAEERLNKLVLGKVNTTYLWWFGGWFIPPTYGSNGSSGSSISCRRTSEQAGLGKVYTTYLWWFGEERLNKLVWGKFIAPIHGDLGMVFITYLMVMWGWFLAPFHGDSRGRFTGPIYDDLGDGL